MFWLLCASPTVLNNVFLNVQTPIVREETRSGQPLDNHAQPAAFGSTSPDRHPRLGEVIVGGNVYQNFDTATSFTRQNYGVEAGPTNVPNTSADFNIAAPGAEQLVVSTIGSNFLPSPGSRLIDSSVSSLTERVNFAAIRSAAGLGLSPVLTYHRC